MVKDVPLFSEDQDGVKVSSETFRGKYIYLDIWATWCGPCKQEMPYMQKLEQQYRGEKIVFVSLSMDRWTEKEKWKLYLAEHRIQGVTLMLRRDLRVRSSGNMA